MVVPEEETKWWTKVPPFIASYLSCFSFSFTSALISLARVKYDFVAQRTKNASRIRKSNKNKRIMQIRKNFRCKNITRNGKQPPPGRGPHRFLTRPSWDAIQISNLTMFCLVTSTDLSIAASLRGQRMSKEPICGLPIDQSQKENSCSLYLLRTDQQSCVLLSLIALLINIC